MRLKKILFLSFAGIIIPFLTIFLMSQNSFALTFPLQFGQSYGKLGTATVIRPWTDFNDTIIQSFSPSDNKYMLTGLLLYPSIPAKTAVGFSINNIDVSWRQYNNGNPSFFNGVNPCNYVSAGGITGMNYQISNCTYSAANGGTGGTDYYHISFNLVAYATTSINIPANALYISIGNRASGFWENNILNTNTIYYNSFDYSSIEYYTSATDGLLQQQINQNQTIINQNNQIIQNQQATTDAINDMNDTITDSDSSGAESSAGSFFENFDTNTFGLTGIITAPLNLIQSITSSNCTDLVLPLPFVDENLTLPCMSNIYSEHFGAFYQIYQIITFGFIAYWVCVRIFFLVKDFKNPDHDEVEVLDL